MNHLLKLALAISMVAAFSACGTGAKEKKGETGDMKVELEKLKKQKTRLDAEIRDLEAKILKADPEAAKRVARLVSVDTIRIKDFEHYIELQGRIDADDIAYVSPSGQGGQVKAVYVKLGSRVSKGQLLVKLDDALARQQLVAAQQQTGVLKARLAQAQTIYERYQNLWKQNIGTEVQVINAKADVDATQSQLNAANAQVAQAQEAVAMTNVHAQISGVIDEMNVEPGEFFSPQTAAQPGMGIRIVNTRNLKMVTQVPENYITRVKKGDKVKIDVKESGKPPYESVISTVGASIDPASRSFTTEARLPSDPALKPNQVATMKILDYTARQTVVVPINLVQTDEKGKYVFVMAKEKDKTIARKRTVIPGEAYAEEMEIKSGLQAGDLVITEGYQVVYDGQTIQTGN